MKDTSDAKKEIIKKSEPNVEADTTTLEDDADDVTTPLKDDNVTKSSTETTPTKCSSSKDSKEKVAVIDEKSEVRVRIGMKIEGKFYSKK